MYEGLTPSDDFAETGEFDRVIEPTVPGAHVPFIYQGVPGALTPENTRVRLFDEPFGDYSRAIVKLDDGTYANLKLEDDLLVFLANCGCSDGDSYPDKPDDTDEEFMKEFMRIWTEDANTELQDLL